MFWTILFLFLSAIAPTQPVARPPAQVIDTIQVGRHINIQGPGNKPACRPPGGGKCYVE